jgi:Xaa-Pro aminopeptidase
MLHSSSSLVSISRNLVDGVWQDRPAKPVEPVTVQDGKYTGLSVDEKLEKIRDMLKNGKPKAVGLVANMLDEVAWLFNLRGTDIPFNPVFFGYGLVTMTDATLFVDSSKLTDDVYKHLGQSVKVKPYEEITLACQQLGQSLKEGEKVCDRSPFCQMPNKSLTSIVSYRY